MLPAGLKGLNNAGPHGLTEMLYAFTSTPANNGSAFAGLTGTTYYYNTLFGFATLIGRFAMQVPMLAAAGFLAEKRIAPESAGTFPVTTPLFVVLLISVILIVGALDVLPGLVARPHRRAPADAEREALLAWPSPSDRCSIRPSSGGRCRTPS